MEFESRFKERRNELIAELFREVHFIEKWGRGISLILSKEPDTEFKEVGTHFIVVFKRKEIEKDTGTTSQRTGEKTREKTREKIIRLIKENPKITTGELADKTGLTVKGLEWNIKNLKKKGLLRRIGADRGGYWEVVGG